MHQDIIDALNLAQRRRHFADGGFGDGSAGPMPTGYVHNMGPDFTPGGNGSNLLSLYQQELGRAPDQEGLNYWMGQLNNGMSMDQVQQMFDQSQEGQAYNQQPPQFSNDPRYPHMPPGGIPGLEGLLGGGRPNNPFPSGTTPDVMNPRNDPYAGGGNGTKAGGQGIGGQGPMPQRTPLEEIDMMYQSQLGRQADEGGRNYWLQQLQGGMPLNQIQQTFANTQEGQDYQKRLALMANSGLGNGTKAGGGGGMPYPGGLGGQGQGPNPNPYGGLGNGTKAGGAGGGGYTGPIY